MVLPPVSRQSWSILRTCATMLRQAKPLRFEEQEVTHDTLLQEIVAIPQYTATVSDEIQQYVSHQPFRALRVVFFLDEGKEGKQGKEEKQENQKQIEVNVALFQDQVRPFSRKWMPLLARWFGLVGNGGCSSSSSSSSSLNKRKVYLVLTPHQKTTQGDEPLTSRHVNSAYAFVCSTVMLVYRNEEWFKVLLHESYHLFGLDWASKESEEDNLQLAVKRVFPVLQEVDALSLYETYTEWWAEIWYLLFWQYTRRDRSIHWAIAEQRRFAVSQCKVALAQQGYTYDSFLEVEQGLSEYKGSQYNESTPVFAYHVSKTLAMIFFNEWLSFVWSLGQGHSRDKGLIQGGPFLSQSQIQGSAITKGFAAFVESKARDPLSTQLLREKRTTRKRKLTKRGKSMRMLSGHRAMQI